jgi:uncharacterized protein
MKSESTSKTVAGGVAVITGASSGIGAIYADRLAKSGYDLILVARDEGRLRDLAQRLRAERSRTVEVVPADLTAPQDLLRIENMLRTETSITMLVNNAGFGASTPLIASDVNRMTDMIALNVNAPMRLAYAAAPAFAERGSGAIINIGSIVAIAPEILNGVYAGTKAFILAFSQSLRHEFSGHGVRIQVVMPGATATDFWHAAGTPLSSLPSEIVMPAEKMVDAALSGFAGGEFVTIPSLPDYAEWEAFEEARKRLQPFLSLATAAPRYGRDG